MFRARAEKVSGKRVFANGKWLMCIGNKSVSVGDLIYTDGRCVYGFYQEAQQPLVITSQKKFEEGIPILAYSSNNLWDCYVLKIPSMKLEKIETIKLKSEYWHMINNFSDKIYVDKDFLSYLLMNYSDIEGANGYIFSNDTNIDLENNFYEVQSLIFDKVARIGIFKNDEVVAVNNFSHLGNSLISEIEAATAVVPGNDYIHGSHYFFRKFEGGILYSDVIFASIENENNWAVILEVVGQGGTTAYDPPPSQFDEDSVYFNQPLRNGNDMTLNVVYLITPAEFFEISRNTFEVEHREYDFTKVDEWQQVTTRNHTVVKTPNVKIPIQDGYYFVINKFIAYEGNVEPFFMNVTIYSNVDEELLKANFHFGTNFAIYKGKILSVNPKSNIAKNLACIKPEQVENLDKIEKIYGRGLYRITGNETKPLELLLNSYVANDKLRTMKNYKNWHTKITNFHETPLEPSKDLISGNVTVQEYSVYR